MISSSSIEELVRIFTTKIGNCISEIFLRRDLTQDINYRIILPRTPLYLEGIRPNSDCDPLYSCRNISNKLSECRDLVSGQFVE